MEGLSSLVREVGLFMESFGYIGARFVAGASRCGRLGGVYVGSQEVRLVDRKTENVGCRLNGPL